MADTTPDSGVLAAVELALAKSTSTLQNAISDQGQALSGLQNAISEQGRALESLTDKVSKLELSSDGGGGARSSVSGDANLTRRGSRSRSLSIASGAPASLSRSATMAQEDAGGEVDTLDPCTIGDQLVFKASEGAGSGGFLIGDAAAFNLGVQEPADHTHRVALNYDEYAFRVVPMLSYRQHSELESKHSLAANAEVDETKKKKKKSELAEEAKALALQEERTEAEERQNQEMLVAVAEGRVAATVKYGDIVQLQHVKSGAFVTVLESAAPVDPECRAVILDKKGSLAAQFKFMPRYKAQTEGSVVYYSHTMVLESVLLRGMSIHASNAPYSLTPDATDVSLPKCLQTGKILEINLSPTSAAFVLNKYVRPNPKQLGDLHSRSLFRLWHSQSECFIQASCNTEKDRENPKGRASGEPSHSPYLKKLPDLGDVPDPSDPANHYPKAIWFFEPLRRAVAGPVAWDTPVRVRHAPSGRYLAVDTSVSEKAHEDGLMERWFSILLVDDSIEEDDEQNAGQSMQTYDVMNNELGFKTVPASSMVFTVTAADVTQGAFLPDADCKLRICHTFTDDDGIRNQVFLHNTEVQRSNSEGNDQNNKHVIIMSFRLVFSSVRSAQDIFKLMLVPEVEAEGFSSVQAFLKPARLYSAEIGDKTKPLVMEQFEETIRFMLKLINLQIKGSFEWDAGVDWVAKANDMMPAPFAELFDGEPDASRQRISRDLKLLDAVFAMSLAAYARLASPWNLEASHPDALALTGAKAVQKLIHVALQRMCAANLESQDYFGRRTSKPFGVITASAANAEKPWMDSILDQLDDPLGSAVTLSKLMSANADLMERYANAALTLRFLNMIKQLGPQSRLINFFEAICTVGGVAVKANQEMILRLTWMNEEARESAYLVTRECTVGEVASKIEPSLPALPKIKLPSGDFTDGKITKIQGNWPKDYIGKEVHEHSSKTWPQVFVHWSWSDHWTPGNSDGALFWSPIGLFGGGEDGIPIYDVTYEEVKSEDISGNKVSSEKDSGSSEDVSGKKVSSEKDSGEKVNSETISGEKNSGKNIGSEKVTVHVVATRVEDLCWVLEPERLCEAITGKKWVEVKADLEKQPNIKERFKRHEQLASYYVGQLSLHAKQCFGRSYNCIAWMEKAFSYTMLCSLCCNPYLPPKIRGAATNLVKALYLDRFPQMVNCGRPSLPEQLWVASIADPNGVDAHAVPLVRPLDLKKEGSLPEFCLTSSHKWSKDSNRFNGFPGHTKFFLLRQFGNEYLKSFGKGSVVHAGMQNNALASNVVGLIAALVSFGFQSTHEKIKALLGFLVPVLDGRSDLKDIVEGIAIPFKPLNARYELTSVSPAVTSLKLQVVKILTEVSNLRANFRLAKLLNTFKAYTTDSKSALYLTKFHTHVEENKVDFFAENVQSGEAFQNKLFSEFEDLFKSSDGKALDLTVLANNLPVDVILLDCLCYQDDALFAAALELLERTYSQRKKLLHALSEVTLLETEAVPVFGNVGVMSSELNFLLFLVRSSGVWGVCSRVAGPFQKDQYDLVLKTCDRISKYLYHSPLESRQRPKQRPSIASQMGSVASDVKKFWSKTRGNTSEPIDNPMTAMHLGSEVETSIDVDDIVSEPTPLHQNVMRSMNLQTTLITALTMDYNLSFKGSICSSEDKIRSRDMLAHAQRELVACLRDFVKGNSRNQDEVIKHLPQLRKHLGNLKLPSTWPEDFTEAHKAKVLTAPGLNTEEVIIECLRNNVDVCEMKIPRDLLEEFGILMNAQPDPNSCMQLELFQLMCLPEGFGTKAVPRNQSMVLDVLLSDNLQHLKVCINDVFLSNNQAEKMPERLVLLLAATICDGNVTTAAMLQSKKISIDATVSKMHTLLVTILRSCKNLPDRGQMGIDDEILAVSDHRHFNALVIFLAELLGVAVVDPKTFRADTTWLVVCVGCSRILSACLKNNTTCTAEIAHAVTAACRVATAFLEGSRSLGLKAKEASMAHELILGNASMRASAEALSSNARLEVYPSLQVAATKLAQVFNPDFQVQSDSIAVVNQSPKDDDTMSAGQNNSTGIIVEDADPMTGLQEDYEAIEMQAFEQQPIETMRNYFHEALHNNPKIKDKLKSRQFELVGILERAEQLTGEGGKVKKVPGGEGQGACTITWTDVVNRMVKFIKAHNFDNDEEPSLRCLRILHMHLLKARSDSNEPERETADSPTDLRAQLLKLRSDSKGDAKGHVFETQELSKEARKEYKAKQAALVDLDVAGVALMCVATHAANIEGNLADEGLELLLEMLNDGNKVVQDAVVSYITQQDRDNKFMTHLELRMRGSAQSIELRKERTQSKFEHMTEDAREAYENAKQTFEIMKVLCEGHNEEAQNILRAQPASTDINTVATAANLVSLLCDTSNSLRAMEDAEVELVVSGLDCLIELVQGPCVGNQELLANLDGFIPALDRIFQSNFHPRVRVELRLEAKVNAAKLVQALFEARQDLSVHKLLAKELEPAMLEMVRNYVTAVLKKTEAEGDADDDGDQEKYQEELEPTMLEMVRNYMTDMLEKTEAMVSFDDDEEQKNRYELSLELMTSIKCIFNELNLVPSFHAKFEIVQKKKREAKKKEDLLDSDIKVVEFQWRDRIERISFPKPEDAEYLTEKTKSEFILNADLSTAEKRMKKLLVDAPVFMAEMQQIYSLSKWSSTYGFIHHNIVNIKWSMYALVVLLNINIVMASYGAERTEGYRSIVGGLNGLEDDQYKGSLYISLVLATINLLGYIIIVTFLAITEVPIIIRRLDDYVGDCLDSLTMRESDYRDLGAFTWWGVTLVFNVLFIIMHLYNYPENPNYSLYYVMVFGVNLPWTLSCLRNYIVVPNTPGTRLFCIGYDVLITKPFFRNHVILMFFSINGYTQSFYFPLMLMDIMNNSDVLANIARSVTDNLGALGWVFYLFICTVVIYAQFGLQYFEDYFHYDSMADDEEAIGCHSVVSCFFLIFYMGIPQGGMGEVLDAVSNRDQPDYLMRVAFDLSFFIWVGVLLFNIITGLMVDGFGSLREEDNERNDILENTCFACGFTREIYDDVPNFRGPKFDYHKSEEHDHWSYVHLYVYLKRRDDTDYSGAESYIWDMIDKNDMSWIPRRNSAAIQAANVSIESKEPEAIDPLRFNELVSDVSEIRQGLLKPVKSTAPTQVKNT